MSGHNMSSGMKAVLAKHKQKDPKSLPLPGDGRSRVADDRLCTGMRAAKVSQPRRPQAAFLSGKSEWPAWPRCTFPSGSKHRGPSTRCEPDRSQWDPKEPTKRTV